MPFFRICTVRVFEVPAGDKGEAEAVFSKMGKKQRDAFERTDLNHLTVNEVA